MVAIAATTGFVSGYWLKHRFVLAEQYILAQASISQLEKNADVTNKITTDHAQGVAEIQIRYKEIIKEVPVYVPANSECNLTRGAVSLLNDAAIGSLPKAAEIPAKEKRDASAVSQRDVVETCADWAVKYNELKAKHDAIIDWYERIYGY